MCLKSEVLVFNINIIKSCNLSWQNWPYFDNFFMIFILSLPFSLSLSLSLSLFLCDNGGIQTLGLKIVIPGANVIKLFTAVGYEFS
jgi:hypothetical protein